MLQLSPLGSLLEERLKNTTETTRRGNVDVYESSLETQEIALCHVFTLLPFTDGEGRIFNSVGTFESMYSLALAAQHLNTGNGSIVQQVTGYHTKCPLRFTLEVHDTELKERVGVDQVITATARAEQLPCFFLGAARSAVSIPTSIITGLRGYPQLSAISTSTALNDKIQHPLFGRTIPADDGTSIPFILYLRDILKVKHLAVIHINDAYGNAFGQGLQETAQILAPDMTVQAVNIPIQATPENIALAVKFLKETNYAYMFGILFPTYTLDTFMEEAVAQGIAGDGQHQWFFSDVVSGDLTSRSFPQGSALQKAFYGAGVISASAGNPQFNRELATLTRALQELNTDARNQAYIQSILPVPFDLNAKGFLDTPGLTAGFVYDAMILAGLAACDVYLNSNNNNNNQSLDGPLHFERMMQLDFDGTTGRIQLDNVTGTRLASSAFFQMINHVPDPNTSNSSEVQYKAVLSDIFQEGAWLSLEEYVFNDGTTTIPPGIPPVNVERNQFSVGIRAGGLLMCVAAMTMGVSFGLWTKYHENHRVVRASQPIFLYIVCLGAIVFASAIVPLSMDDGVIPPSGCNIACQSVPWLLCIGFSLTFSALFTKTYRINKIFHQAGSFKRIKLTAWDVAKPMLVLLGLNIFVLSLSTALAPVYWDFSVERRDAFGQTLEGYGYCSAADAWPYLSAAAALNFIALCFAVVQAYQARNISLEFSESDYIFRATMSILMVCFLGVPVLILARENSDAYFFVFSAIIFLTSCCILMLIFVPKIQFLRQSNNSNSSNNDSTRNHRNDSDQVSFGTRFGRHVSTTAAAGSDRPVVSGFESPSGAFIQNKETECANPDSGLASTNGKETEVDDDDDDDDKDESDDHGLRIITNKTQQELLEEIKLLKKKLRAALKNGQKSVRIELSPEESVHLIPVQTTPTTNNATGSFLPALAEDVEEPKLPEEDGGP